MNEFLKMILEEKYYNANPKEKMYNYIFFTDVTDTIIIYKAIGVYKLAHQLRKKGKKCLVVDHLHTWNFEEIKELIDLSVGKTTIGIGFSNTFFKNTETAQTREDGGVVYGNHNLNNLFPQGKDFENKFVSYVKRINPNIKIILGGAKASQNISNKNIDVVVQGFAEPAILELHDRLQNNDSFTRTEKNIWGVVVMNKDKAGSSHNFSESDFSWTETDVVNHKLLNLETSRGCIFKCKFCSYPLIGKKKLDYIKNPSLIEYEIKQNWEEFGIKDYYILDDTFNDTDVKIDKILESVKKLSFQPKFWAYTRLDLLTAKNQISKLYDMGLHSMYFGIETLNPKTAASISKGSDRSKQIKQVQEIALKYPEVRMHGSFILGLPGESIRSVTETFEMCQTQELPLHSYDFKPLHLYDSKLFNWSSELDKTYVNHGYIGGNVDANTGIRYWSNEHTNFDEVTKLSQHFNNESQVMDHFRIPGQLAFGLKNYNYSDTYIRDTKYRDVDWCEITQSKEKFIVEYKKKLLYLIKQET